MLRDLVLKNRSYRRFDQATPVTEETLREIVDLARQSASATNRQPLKYILSWEPTRNALVFAQLAFARLLPDWGGPVEGQRPTAYIVVLGDKDISQSFYYDCGIACQTILLGATEKGLGGCMFGSVNRVELRKALSIAERYEILLVVAIGKPAETVILEPAAPGANVNYYRDEIGAHHVPKRSLDEVIIG
jgi:nitroreductase